MSKLEMNRPHRSGAAAVRAIVAVVGAVLIVALVGCDSDAQDGNDGAYLRVDDMVVMRIQSEAPTQYMGARVMEVLGDSVRLCPGDSSFLELRDAVANAVRATPGGPGHPEIRVVAIDEIKAREKAGVVEIIHVPAK